MGLVWQSGLKGDIARLSTAIEKLERKLDEAISQAEKDRIVTQAHVAECNILNKRADEDELNAKREWEAFKANVFAEIEGLFNKVGKAEVKLSWMVGGLAGVGWAVTVVGWVADHFHLAIVGH